MLSRPFHNSPISSQERSSLFSTPFDWDSEAELNIAPERVHLCSANGSSSSLALDAPVSKGRENFSQVKRQLLRLARTILQQPKILIRNGATSSVDMETNGYTQHAIRS